MIVNLHYIEIIDACQSANESPGYNGFTIRSSTIFHQGLLQVHLATNLLQLRSRCLKLHIVAVELHLMLLFLDVN